LKDRENVVSLNIPVKGESGDPSFSYRKLIASALRNTIEKVVTAPFSILGSLLPGDQEIQRDFVGFKEGRKDLTPQTRGMLDKLATILEARPGLALDLTPSYHPGEDPGALQERLYEEAVTSRMKKEGLSRKAAIEELHDELPGKQKAKGWFPSFNAQKKALRESFTCDEERLEQLAKARAETVRKHLVETHGIDSSRIRISKVERGKHRVDLGVETR
ncbi:MAG: hypothetical protein R3242_00155, partial [Akkermansiaceae bacterium]|nr:hypothetical protein [Akkermansiaceae bacterium]